ncbi:hypothetical protein OG799_08835 [Micromonospora sp. NBC_00898]|uniref:hypothetical protein n=1 Tax=Micromonospora sp. NBC_00898 TaxID=2975981 RepID=UPI003863F2F9|nr:hypothetical protein OG799_08835 [Micromonospora sp. NBC_00898]
MFGTLAVVLGVVPLLLAGALTFAAVKNHRIQVSNDAFAAVAWHNLRSDEVFPDFLQDTSLARQQPPGWSRQGMAKASDCSQALAEELAKAAVAQGCTTALQATYVDIGGEMAATVALCVVGSYQQAGAVVAQFDVASAPGPMVYPVAVPGTAAAGWNKKLAYAGGTHAVGLSTNSPPYFVAITVGPLDARRQYGRLPGDWAISGRGERKVYQGVADDLLGAYARAFDMTVSGR